jgi:ABC-2 type transport system ATP-binding protein
LNNRKIKMVLPEGLEIRELYRIAAEGQIEIRRLDYKRDSLQDIFLKAMTSDRRPAAEVERGGL